MLLDLFTEHNITNTVARYLADKLVGFGYLVYWHEADAVQTADGWWTNYKVNQPTYAADPLFQSRLAAAKGMVTITDGETAFPRFVARPNTEGVVADQDQVQVPVFGISLGADVVTRPYEAGTELKWRVRALTIEGRLRNKPELQQLSDKLAAWFTEDQRLWIVDHSGESGEDPQEARIDRRSIVKDVVAGAGHEDRYQLEMNVRLEYVA